MPKPATEWPHLAASGSEETVTDTDSTQIDALTLVKAQQAISGEIVLEQLAATLLRVAIENAGARAFSRYVFASAVVTTRPKLTIDYDPPAVLNSAPSAEVMGGGVHGLSLSFAFKASAISAASSARPTASRPRTPRASTVLRTGCGSWARSRSRSAISLRAASTESFH